MFVNKGKDAVCGGSEYGVMRWDVCKCVNVWCEKSVIEVEGMWCWDVGVGCVIDWDAAVGSHSDVVVWVMGGCGGFEHRIEYFSIIEVDVLWEQRCMKK